METKEYRYILPKKGKKMTCPKCGRNRCFRLYVDTKTGEPVAPDVGRCDHENSCGENYTPRDYFRDHPELKQTYEKESARHQNSIPKREFIPCAPAPQTEFYPVSWVYESMKRASPFHTWFEGLPFNPELTRCVLYEYFVGGTADEVRINGINYGHAVVFWMVDERGNVRDGKMMAYTCDGHRVQGWGNSVRSVCEKKKVGPQLPQTDKVLFGLHLLEFYPEKEVCIVESEKTALVCACRYPEYLWLATGGCGNLNAEKLKPLIDRRVVVFPDSGEYSKWLQVMKNSPCQNYTVASFLEKYPGNTDLADIILDEIIPSVKL